MHETPTDIRAVLHDYAQDMVLPALEVYTDGLMTDPHVRRLSGPSTDRR